MVVLRFEKEVVFCFRAGLINVNTCLIVLRRSGFRGLPRIRFSVFPGGAIRPSLADLTGSSYFGILAPLISGNFSAFSVPECGATYGIRAFGGPELRIPYREFVLRIRAHSGPAEAHACSNEPGPANGMDWH
jgi:hypothetical protein